MSFILRKVKYRPWPVTVKLVTADEAGVVTESEFVFVLHFGAFSEAVFKAILDELEAADKAPAVAEPVEGGAVLTTPSEGRSLAYLLEKNAMLFGRVIEGWGKVVDEAGGAVPFSLGALHALVTGPDGLAVSAGIHQALSELRYGVAPAKNSPTSVAPGLNPDAVEAVTKLPEILPPLA